MRNLLFWSLFLGFPGSCPLLQGQAYFENYISDQGLALETGALAQLPGGQIAVGGRVVDETDGQSRAFLTLFSANGNLVWARLLGLPGDGRNISDIRAASDGGILITITAPAGSGLGGVAKIRIDGTPEWSRGLPVNMPGLISGVRATGSGFLLTGTTDTEKGLVVKIDASGAVTWSRIIGETGAKLSLQSSWQDPDGFFYIAGRITRNGQADGALLKISNDGQLHWSRRFATSESDNLSFVAPGPGNTLLSGGTTEGYDNYSKGWLISTDREGGVSWSRTYGRPAANLELRGLEAYPGGAVFAVSEAGTSPDLGAAIARVNSSGELLWLKRFDKGGIGFAPKLTLSKNQEILFAATLQTGAGRGCLLVHADGNGDVPPCCAISENLSAPEVTPQTGVFVPDVSVSDALLPLALNSVAFNPDQRSWCTALIPAFTMSDSVICPGSCVELSITDPVPGVQYAWSYPGGTADPQTPERVCFPNIQKDVIITLTADHCTYRQFADTLKVRAMIASVANAFTPDGDGVNDVFKPLLSCPFDRYRFAVYSRWGDPVFETGDPALGWDGRFNNRDAPMDTYAWVLNFEGPDAAMVRQHGSITLIR